MKYLLSVCFALLSTSILAQETLSTQSRINLSPPLEVPFGLIKTPIPDYFVDMKSIKLNQNDSDIIKYDMVTNLTEGSNTLSKDHSIYTHSMRSNLLLNCKTGESSSNGIEVFSEFFGIGQSITSIPQRLEWSQLPDLSAKTIMAKMICMRMKQSYKNQTPIEIENEMRGSVKP